MSATPEPSGLSDTHTQLRGLLVEFRDHIANALQHELSQQTAALTTIIQREGERQSPGAGQSFAKADESANGVPRKEGEGAAGPEGSITEHGPLAVVTRAKVTARRAHPRAALKHVFDSSEFAKGLKERNLPSFEAFYSAGSVMTATSTVASNTTFPDVYFAPARKAWDPDSATRMAYELLSMLAVLYDSIMIPFTLAWEVQEHGVYGGIAQFSRCFWTMDLFLSFITGYRTKHLALELRLRKTVKHFLMTWFVVDLALVILEWVGVALPGLRLIRLVRLVRVTRQSRRAFNLARKVKAKFYAKAVHLTINISALLVLFLWMAHVFCCGWYALGRYPTSSDTGLTWLVHGDGKTPYSSVGALFEYTTALHWSLTQFTPASMEVVPTNTKERIYAILVIMWGFVVGTTTVATLSAMMTQYRLYVEESQLKMRQLDSYLDQEKISPELCKVARTEVLRILGERQRLRASEVSHLSLVSTSMQRAVRVHVVSRHLSSHVFFGAWCQADHTSFAAFCSSCVEERYYIAGDTCFRANENGQNMFFVKAGALMYKPGSLAPETSFPAEDPRLLCRVHSMASEVAMWLKWVHLGTMVSSTTTEVFTVKANAAAEELVRYVLSAALLRDYAFAFYTYMSEPDAIMSDLTYGIDYQGLMFAMPLEFRMALSEALLSPWRPFRRSGMGRTDTHTMEMGEMPTTPILRTRMSRAQVKKLWGEVITGKTCVGVLEQELVRFVFVAAMRVYHRPTSESDAGGVGSMCEDDVQEVHHRRYLVKLGELDRNTGGVATTCVLPGSKRREQETSAAAMERVVDEELGAMDLSIEWHPMLGRSETRTFKISPTSGLKTVYSRTVYTGFACAEQAGWSITAPGKGFAPQSSAKPTRVALPCPSRKRSTCVQAVQEHVTEILRGIPHAVVCDREHRRFLYAWLLDEEFQALEGDAARPILEQWLREVTKSTLRSI